MVIRNSDMAKFIRDPDCDYYDDHITGADYSSVLTYQPKYTLDNIRTKCRKLEMLRHTNNPIWLGEVGLGEYQYRSLEPRYRSRNLEYFDNNISRQLLILLILFIIGWYLYFANARCL